ncbi:hypothetical protein ACQP25_20495 [Microtetraspora malaysiensis]
MTAVLVTAATLLVPSVWRIRDVPSEASAYPSVYRGEEALTRER